MEKQSKTAFVLDDDADVCTIVCRVLERFGYRASSSSSPSDLSLSVEEDPPELVVIDLNLGRTDAIEVIKDLAKRPFDGNVILMSGNSSELLAEISKIGLGRGLSMLPPLKKPFTHNELREAINSVPSVVELKPVITDNEALKVSLLEALQNGWVEVWYQPKIDLKTFEISGAEALARVMHPQFGQLMPSQFLPPVGDPVYFALTDFILETVFSNWQVHESNSNVKVAVNVPASVVLAEGFVSKLREMLPEREKFAGLIIEITEDEMVQDYLKLAEIVCQLRLSGVEISIDDFGTAHSSLAHLREIPCSEVKLDRSFVTNCTKDKAKNNICRAVSALCSQFNIRACAEGVETREDLLEIINLGFDCAQGYFFAKPMRFELIMAMLVRVQNQLDRMHDLKNGGFLAHRSNTESRNEIEIGNTWDIRAGRERHPPGDKEAVFG